MKKMVSLILRYFMLLNRELQRNAEMKLSQETK